MTQLSIALEGCLSALAIDRVLGEGRSRDLDEHPHVRTCARCQARVARQRAWQQRFLEAPPALPLPPIAAPADELSARRSRRRSIAGVASVVALAAAVALVWWMLPRAPGVPEVALHHAARTKGGEQLLAFVRRDDRVWRAAPGEHVRAGDQLRFAYTCAQECYLLIAGRDATGATVVHFSDRGRPARLPPGVEALLPTALELDDQPGDVFFGVFCAAPSSVEQAVEALRTRGSLGELPGECGVDQLELVKEHAP